MRECLECVVLSMTVFLVVFSLGYLLIPHSSNRTFNQHTKSEPKKEYVGPSFRWYL